MELLTAIVTALVTGFIGYWLGRKQFLFESYHKELLTIRPELFNLLERTYQCVGAYWITYDDANYSQAKMTLNSLREFFILHKILLPNSTALRIEQWIALIEASLRECVIGKTDLRGNIIATQQGILPNSEACFRLHKATKPDGLITLRKQEIEQDFRRIF